MRLKTAIEECFQEGITPTDAVIARKLGVRRETINRWRRQNHGLRAWLGEGLAETSLEGRPYVDRRVTHLAIVGSVEHAKLFYQFVAKLGTPAGEGDPSTLLVPTQVYLVPRPAYPPLAPAPALPPPLTLHDIPTLALR